MGFTNFQNHGSVLQNTSFYTHVYLFLGFRVVRMVKNPPAMQETWVLSLGWEDPLEEGMATPFQYSCLENPHGQRSPAFKRPWGCKESDMTEQPGMHIHFYAKHTSHWFSFSGDPEKHSSCNILFKPGRSSSLAPLLQGFLLPC